MKIKPKLVSVTINCNGSMPVYTTWESGQ